MSTDGGLPAVRGRLLTMRIVHGALLMGSVVYAVIAIYLRKQGQMPTPAQPIVSLICGALAGAELLVLPVLPVVLAAKWRKTIAAGANPLSATSSRRSGVFSQGQAGPPKGEDLWWALYQVRLVIMGALMDGVVFANLTAYLVEGQDWSLAVAGLFMLLLALLIPTRSRVAGWVRLQQELVEQQRSGV